MILEVIAFSVDKYPALLIMKYTIDALTRNVSYSSYSWSVVPLIGLMLILKLLRIFINTNRPVRDQIITEKLFNSFFKQCMKLDYQNLESKEMQDKKELAKYIANGKIAAIGWYFVEMFSSFIALIIATFFLIGICPIVLLMVVLGLIVKSFITKKVLNKTTPISKQQIIDNRYLHYLYSIGSDYEYVKEFRIFHYKEKLLKKIEEAKRKHFDANGKLQSINLIQSILYNVDDFNIKTLSYAIMGFYCLKNILTLSNFTFVIGLVNDFISYTNSLTSSCKSYVQATSYIEHYFQFMSRSSITTLLKEDSQTIKKDNHIIEFKNVYFKYPNSENYALKGLNFQFQIPTKISLVGHNGAGKSTLIKLLLRLYHPDEGLITLDGKDIFEYAETDYMKHFSSVFQDFILFAFTIAENVTSFDLTNKKLLNRIILETGVNSFIDNYPDKSDTYISNVFSIDGVEFSGGEQQKIALARSIYKNGASFYVLDEPTSTYDANAEYKLYQKYEELLSQKASIFISHRLSSCKLSDRVILLEDGAIVEDGTHDTLMKRGGKYKYMFELQSKQYKWEDIKDEE